jgi:sulfoxide reductase heme-binding subunit YedZ
MHLRLLNWFNQHDHWFRVLLFAVSLLPALRLLFDTYTKQLGFNPFDALIARTGFWAMLFLILTLAITPARRWLGFCCRSLRLLYGKRLADWNFLIKARRMLGLFSFFYLSWHLGIYLHLELDWSVQWFWQDLLERPFIAAGLAGWIIALLLAITSPQRARRKMGRRWRQLHRAMYILSLLAAAHVLLEAKVGDTQAFVFSVLIGILLLHRLLTNYVSSWQRPDDNGLEAKR